MAQDDHSGADLAVADSSHAAHEPAVSPGTAIVSTDGFQNPGFPPHRPRGVHLLTAARRWSFAALPAQ